MKIFLSFIIVILLIFSFWLQNQSVQKERELNLKILELENKISLLNKEKLNLNNKDQKVYSSITNNRINENTHEISKEKIQSQAKVRTSNQIQMGSRFGIANIERFVVLQSDQKVEIQRLLEESLERAQNGEKGVQENYEKSLQEILGSNLYSNLKEAENEERSKRQQERIEQEVFTYSRKLNLNPDQEKQMMDIYKEARATYFPEGEGFRQAMMFQDEQTRRESMINYFKNRKAMKENISNTLQSVLSDQQYNQYLELEHSSSGSSLHEQMLINEEKENNN